MTRRSGEDAAAPNAAADDLATAAAPGSSVAVVGAGRLGSVLIKAMRAAGYSVTGPHGRGYRGATGAAVNRIVVLCVPDAAIAAAAALIEPGPLVAHCSGATGLAAIAPHRGFSMHPVMTLTPRTAHGVLAGTAAAIAGTDAPALLVARRLAEQLKMLPFTVAESDRAAYHAATAMAANFLITLESAAGSLLRTTGVDPKVLLPLARAALENWGEQGPAALTGPVARGDRAVVGAHRRAVAERTPDLLPMFDSMVAATQQLADARVDETAPSARTFP